MKKICIILILLLFAGTLAAQDIRKYDPFSGFHFGYTASVGVTRPCDVFPNIGDYPSPEGLPGCSYLAGIEASYHFNDFFGVSVGLEYGDTWRQKVRIQYPLRGEKYVFSNHYSSLYFPVKLLQLDTILRNAVKYGKPKPPKKGVKNQAAFSQMREMRYDLAGVGTVKMMVGIKRTGEIIQYCITAIQK